MPLVMPPPPVDPLAGAVGGGNRTSRRRGQTKTMVPRRKPPQSHNERDTSASDSACNSTQKGVGGGGSGGDAPPRWGGLRAAASRQRREQSSSRPRTACQAVSACKASCALQQSLEQRADRQRDHPHASPAAIVSRSQSEVEQIDIWALFMSSDSLQRGNLVSVWSAHPHRTGRSYSTVPPSGRTPDREIRRAVLGLDKRALVFFPTHTRWHHSRANTPSVVVSLLAICSQRCRPCFFAPFMPATPNSVVLVSSCVGPPL